MDKLDLLIKKWQVETRDEIKRRGEREFDFLAGGGAELIGRVKDHTKEFVEG